MIHKTLQELAQLRLTENTWSVNFLFATPESSNRATREILVKIGKNAGKGKVTNFDVEAVEPTLRLDMFNRYYLELGNPNPLSGIL